MSIPILLLNLNSESSFVLFHRTIPYRGGRSKEVQIEHINHVSKATKKKEYMGTTEKTMAPLLQYSCLEKPGKDRGAWYATAHGVVKSWTD